MARVLVVDDEPGVRTALHRGLTAEGMEVVSVGDRWFFPAGRRSTRELWRTDGTPAGTRLVLDVNASGNGAVDSLVAGDGVIWFVGDDGIRGRQLWRYVPASR